MVGAFGVRCADGRQEGLRGYAHPDHQDEQKAGVRSPSTTIRSGMCSRSVMDTCPSRAACRGSWHVAARDHDRVRVRHPALGRRTCAGTSTACSRRRGSRRSAAKTAQWKFAMRRALQHQKLADEIVQRRQADAGQRRDQEHRGEPGRRRRDPAVVLDLERVPALVQHARPA